jgi:hypothetical protein
MKEVFYPQSLVKVNGNIIPFLTWEVENNISSTADTFSVVFEKSVLEKARFNNTYFYYTEDDVYVEIYFGTTTKHNEILTEKTMKLMISGFVDSIDWEYREDTVVFRGRDKTALFLDNEVNSKFVRQTVESVIRALAAKRGLQAVIDPAVVGKTKSIGRVLNGEQSHISEGETEWDLMSRFARDEGRDLFVRGNQLIYRNVIDPYLKPVKKFGWGDDLEDLQLKRTLKNRRNRIAVTIRSWDSSKNRQNEYTAVAGYSVGRQEYKKRNYTFKKPLESDFDAHYILNIPGLSPSEVKAKAQTLVKEIYKHELNITFSAPCDEPFDMESVIYLDNIPIPANQYFIPKRVVTSFGVSSGAVVSYTCVNHVLPVRGNNFD